MPHTVQERRDWIQAIDWYRLTQLVNVYSIGILYSMLLYRNAMRARHLSVLSCTLYGRKL